jgi:hypothetical protein
MKRYISQIFLLILCLALAGCLDLNLSSRETSAPTTFTPGPLPPAGLIKDTIEDELIRADIVELTKKVRKEPAVYLKDLVTKLVSFKANDFLKVKILHDWVTLNISYDADAFIKNTGAVTETLATIKYGRTVCAGFANILADLCHLANFQCYVVNGKAKGVGYNPSKPETIPGHAWNAVRIQGGWYLIDSTWDEGYFANNQSYKKYGTDYLFSPPQAFIHSHFPQNEKLQLLTTPVSFNQFLNLPHLNAAFYTKGFSFVNEPKSVETVAEKVSLILNAPPDVDILTGLTDSKNSFFPNTVWQSKTGNQYKIDIVFPITGQFIVSFFYRTPGSKVVDENKKDSTTLKYEYKNLAEFNYQVTKVTGKIPIYPTASLSGKNIFDCLQIKKPVLPYFPEVDEEAEVILTGCQDKKFIISVSKKDKQESALKATTYYQREGDAFIVKALFPAKGEYELNVSVIPAPEDKIKESFGLTFFFNVQKASDQIFPLIYTESFTRYGMQIKAGHAYHPVLTGTTTGSEIIFAVDEGVSVMAYINEDIPGAKLKNLEIKRLEQDYAIKPVFPGKGKYKLTISGSKAESKGTYTGMVAYTFEIK